MAERVGREPTYMYLQAFHFEVTLKRRVLDVIWCMGHSSEGEVLDHLQDSSLVLADEGVPRRASVGQVEPDVPLIQ